MRSLDSLNVDDKQIVWRYFDFPKFVHLLESSSLYFSRLDLLGDPFEGSVTTADLTALHDSWESMSESSGTPIGLYSQHHRLREFDPRHQVFVSCWHMSDVESVAMWRLYAGEMKGIALKSSIGKIRGHLPTEGRLRRVKYIDYGIDKTLHLSPAYCKRKAFEYEQEVRAVIPRNITQVLAGFTLTVDLNSLIEEIRLAPDMPSWMVDLVQTLLARYNVNTRCLPSSLDVAPQFDWEIETGQEG